MTLRTLKTFKKTIKRIMNLSAKRNEMTFGYIMLDKNFLESVEVRTLTNESRSDQIMADLGTYIAIELYLSKCDNAIGDTNDIKNIMSKCRRRKSSILRIININKLFYRAGDKFQSRHLVKSMKIDNVIGAEKKEDDKSYPTANRQPADNKPITSTSYMHTRINNNINTNRINDINSYVNKNKKKTSTSSFEEVKVKEKIEEGGEVQDFNFFWKKLIKDKAWLDKVERKTNICVSSDGNVRKITFDKFAEHVELYGTAETTTSLGRAKHYFLNWIREGRDSRKELDAALDELEKEYIRRRENGE